MTKKNNGWVDDWEGRLNKQEWLDEQEKKLVHSFILETLNSAKPPGRLRIQKFITDIIESHKMTGMRLLEVVKDLASLKKAAGKINSSKDYKNATKGDCKKIIGRLYNFRHNKDTSLKYADSEIRKLLEHHKEKNEHDEATITREEMRELLGYCDKRDSALICTLFDSGARIGELVQMKKKDVRFDKEGIFLFIPKGKTISRTVFVKEVKSHLAAWLNAHPIKDAEGPLWVDEDGRPIGPAGIAKRIDTAVRKMNAARQAKGIPKFSKKYNPHWFRHSRASELGTQPGITASIMNSYFGWEQNSGMPAVYIGKPTDEKMKSAMMFIEGQGKPEEIKPTTRICRLCKESNPISMNFCGRCGSSMEKDKETILMAGLQEQLKEMKARLDAHEKSLKIRIARDAVEKIAKRKKPGN